MITLQTESGIAYYESEYLIIGPSFGFPYLNTYMQTDFGSPPGKFKDFKEIWTPPLKSSPPYFF